MHSCEIQRPDDGTNAIGVAGVVAVRIAVAVDIREIEHERGITAEYLIDEQRLPQGIYCFGLAVACTAALNRFASDFLKFLI